MSQHVSASPICQHPHTQIELSQTKTAYMNGGTWHRHQAAKLPCKTVIRNLLLGDALKKAEPFSKYFCRGKKESSGFLWLPSPLRGQW